MVPSFWEQIISIIGRVMLEMYDPQVERSAIHGVKARG